METTSDSKSTGKTILVVDDELGVLEVLEYILADLGYSVMSAINGRDALERIKETKPDLIVLDFMMPVMDGAQFLQALREDAACRAIPVVLTSALPEKSINQKCSGFEIFLRKPYKYENLIEAIETMVGKPVNKPEEL
jgi:CheY-like chemotaxis protein